MLIIILNRVYCFLAKVKNQSPFFGAMLLVSLLINSILNNLITFIYILNDKPYKMGAFQYFIIWGVIYLLVHIYSIKRRPQIVEIKPSIKLNIITAGVFLITLIMFIWCANINREKLSKEKPKTNVLHKKESLEGKIRKLFE